MYIKLTSDGVYEGLVVYKTNLWRSIWRTSFVYKTNLWRSIFGRTSCSTATARREWSSTRAPSTITCSAIRRVGCSTRSSFRGVRACTGSSVWGWSTSRGYMVRGEMNYSGYSMRTRGLVWRRIKGVPWSTRKILSNLNTITFNLHWLVFGDEGLSSFFFLVSAKENL